MRTRVRLNTEAFPQHQRIKAALVHGSVSRRGAAMKRKSKWDTRKKGAAKKRKEKETERTGNSKLLQLLLRDHIRTRGCFKCKRKDATLQIAHLEPRVGPKIMASCKYVEPKNRSAKRDTLHHELKQTGILCKACHEEHDAELRGLPPCEWKEEFAEGGVEFSQSNEKS